MKKHKHKSDSVRVKLEERICDEMEQMHLLNTFPNCPKMDKMRDAQRRIVMSLVRERLAIEGHAP